MVRKTLLGVTALFCCTLLASLRVLAQPPAGDKTGSQQADKTPVPALMPNPFLHPRPDPESARRAQELNSVAGNLWKEMHKHYQKGNLAEAEKVGEQAVLRSHYLNYENKRELYFLGRIYLKEGQDAKALEYFRQAFPLGEDPSLYLDMALAYYHLDDLDHAQFLFIATSVQHYLTSDLLKEGMGGAKLPEETLPDRNDEHGFIANLLLARGMDYLYKKAPAEALEDFQAAAKRRPQNPLIHYYWALALGQLGRFSEAISHYKLAAQNGSGNLQTSAQARLVQTQIVAELHAIRQAEQNAQEQAKTAP